MSSKTDTESVTGPDLFSIHPNPAPHLIDDTRISSGRLTSVHFRLKEEQKFNAAWDHKIKTPFDFHTPPPHRDPFPYDAEHEEFKRNSINPFHSDNFPFFFSSPSIFLP